MTTVTIRVERGSVNRVPRGQTPTVALELADNERLVDAAVTEAWTHADRKTVDWTYRATIVREEDA